MMDPRPDRHRRDDSPADHRSDGPARDEAVGKPAEERVTGDEPMTGPQRSYLRTLAREAGEDLPEDEPTKAAASELIERLQRATGRIPADRQR